MISPENASRLYEAARPVKGVIQSAIFSADGKTLVVANTAGIYFYDSDPLQERKALDTRYPVKYASISPDGEKLVLLQGTSYLDAELCQVRARTAELTRTLMIKVKGGTGALAYHPQGGQLAFGTAAVPLHLFDSLTGESFRLSVGAGIIGLIYSRDGRLLASGHTGSTIRLWDTESLQLLHTLSGGTPNHWQYGLAFSPDSRILAAQGQDEGGPKGIWLWDTTTGQLIAKIPGAGLEIRAITFTPDGRSIAWGDVTGRIKQWSLAENKLLATYEGAKGVPFALSFSSDGARLTLAARGGLFQWDANSRQSLAEISYPILSRIQLLGFSREAASGSELLWATTQGEKFDDCAIQVWEAETGQPVLTMKGDSSLAGELNFNHDGSLIAAANGTSAVKIWRFPKGKLEYSLSGDYENQFFATAFSLDEKLLAAGGCSHTEQYSEFSPERCAGGVIWVWSLETGQTINKMILPGEVFSVMFSRDNKYLLSWGKDDSLAWDVIKGEQLSQFPDQVEFVAPMQKRPLYSSATPDGKLKAAARGKDILLLSEDQAPVRFLFGHAQPVSHLAFSSSGRFLASVGGADLSLRIWGVTE